MIDTHCHLTFPDFAGSIDRVLADAADAGVTGAITISTSSATVDEVLAVAKAHDNVWCSSGVHPLYTDEDPRDWAALKRVAAHPKCVAWGELGLDKHYDEPDLAIQKEVLAEQLALIETCRDEGHEAGMDLPIVVHCRKAVPEILPILKASTIDPAKFVFHCFTEHEDDARAVLDFGAMISFTGVVTYKNAAEVVRSAEVVPLDRMMVETDAPFLSPVPVRSKRPCEPAYAMHTARRLAEIKGVSLPEFLSIIDQNSERFFGIRAPAPHPPVVE